MSDERVKIRRKKGDGSDRNLNKKLKNTGLAYKSVKQNLVAAKMPPSQNVICKCQFNCQQIPFARKMQLFSMFYKLSVIEKGTYMMSLIQISEIRRRRHGSYNDPSESRRQATMCYTIPVDGQHIRVCRSTLLDIFKVSRRQMEGYVARKKLGEEIFADGRGIKQWKSSRQPLNKAKLTDLQLPKYDQIDDPCKRTGLLQKFADAIEKSMTLICEISANENIRKEDTKKGIQLLIDYLRYYAACTMVLDEHHLTDDVLCIFEGYVYPGLLGMVLGPVLALGNSAIITTNNQLNFCALLSGLATEVGYPPGTITVFNVEKTVTPDFKNWNQSKTVLYFGYDDILEMTNSDYLRRLLNIQYGKTPMVVFDSADQQSACEVLIDAVWSYNGKLPWSVDTVFVQENIWNDFLTKLKRTINQHTLDFAVQQIQSSEIAQMVSDAKARGIEIYQGDKDPNFVAFIGQRVYETNVIQANSQVATTLTVLPFRTINEGVTLANNNRQGLAASIWGENISQVNEAAKKLQVSTVWINSFGVFRPDVSFVPWKESGCGYFGGINALLEQHLPVKKENSVQKKFDSTKIKSLYAVATTSQISWAKMGYANRSRIFTKLVGVLNKQKPLFEDWITAIYKSLTSLNNLKNHMNLNDLNDFDVHTYREPIGVIAIEDVSSTESKQFLLKSLLLGNVVFLEKTIESPIEAIFMEQFPKGVVNIIDAIGEASSIADEYNVMVIVKKCYMPSQYMKKCRNVDDESAELYVTRTKSVWASIGQTYC